jgi:hypothetical protein
MGDSMMRRVLAATAIVAMSSTAALACPMSANHSTAVDRELVVASIASDVQRPDTTEARLLEEVEDEAAE